ncbi:MAG: GntR family transcriptional regulator, partial [Thermomicrobiales bacterium]
MSREFLRDSDAPAEQQRAGLDRLTTHDSPQYQRIAGVLRARIAAGDVRPGERVPAIRALAAELH